MARNSAANVPFSAVLRLRSGFRRILYPNQHLERQFGERHWLGDLLELRFARNSWSRCARRVTRIRPTLHASSKPSDKLLRYPSRGQPQTELRLKESFLSVGIVAGLANGAPFQ